MGPDNNSIGHFANIADFIVDLFVNSNYDKDSDSNIEVDELDGGDVDQWNKFCKRNDVCGGMTRGDVAKIISNPDEVGTFFNFVPAMFRNWDHDDGIYLRALVPPHSITAMVPQFERMPRETALRAITATRDFWMDFNVFAGRELESGRMSEDDYLMHRDAMANYLKAAAANQSPEDFLKTVDSLYKRNRELQNIARLVEDRMRPAYIQDLYSRLRARSPEGYKNVMLFNKQENAFEVRVVKKEKKYPRGGNLILVAASRSGKGNRVFNDNIMRNVPWLANIGRIELSRSVQRARRFLNSKGAAMRIEGLKDVPITNVIPSDMLIGIIYTEREWNAISSSSTDEQILDAAANVDIRIALVGRKAYAHDVSSVGASGIAQLMPGTYDDIKDAFPDLLTGTYEETTSNMDASIVAMTLVLARKAEILARDLKGKEWKEDAMRAFFLSAPIDARRIAVKALAIAYNQGGSLPAKFAHTENPKLETKYATSVSNVMDAI